MAPELWNVQNPGPIESLSQNFLKAGSEILLTNTFGANRYVLDKSGAAERVEELARAGVALCKRVADGRAKVFASIGPTAKIVMMEEISRDDFRAAFAETAEAVCREEPDAIVLESFYELEELQIALEAVRETCDLPVVVSMSFTAGEDGTATMMGNSPEELAHMAEQYGADAVGANCGIGPDTYLKVAGRLLDNTDLPVWIKPNAGRPESDSKGNSIFPIGPEEFAEYAERFRDMGVRVIGGCCGTTPEHIRAIKKRLNIGSQST
jgi:5-methyltetrahydrofolate--homocysteine methyltransferase